MRTYRILLGAIGALACLLPSISPAAQGPDATPQMAAVEPPTVRDGLSGATGRLDSPRFADREAATRELTAAGAPAVAALLQVAQEGSLEAAVRAVGILEAIYVSAGESEESTTEEFWSEYNDLMRVYLWSDLRQAQTTADAAEFALDELERTGRPAVAERAETVLESHYDLRERRAVFEVERLHGKAIYGGVSASVFKNAWANPAAIPNEMQSGGARGRGELTMVIIGPKWTGGDEGLKHVARLKRLHQLYRIEGKQVSDTGIMRLRAALPTLEISVRAAAKLGIEHRPDIMSPGVEPGCVIDTVKPGEAAANAGLRSRDVILSFAGQPVVDFDSLIKILHHYNPGDTVEAIISRNEVPQKVQLTLTGWD